MNLENVTISFLALGFFFFTVNRFLNAKKPRRHFPFRGVVGSKLFPSDEDYEEIDKIYRRRYLIETFVYFMIFLLPIIFSMIVVILLIIDIGKGIYFFIVNMIYFILTLVYEKWKLE